MTLFGCSEYLLLLPFNVLKTLMLGMIQTNDSFLKNLLALLFLNRLDENLEAEVAQVKSQWKIDSIY